MVSCVDAATVKKPTVTFTANKVTGTSPLGIVFTTKTTNSPTSYYWTFIRSDGYKGSDWNSKHAVTASHTFKEPGIYTVTCTVTNKAGSATSTRTKYINVQKPAPKPTPKPATPTPAPAPTPTPTPTPVPAKSSPVIEAVTASIYPNGVNAKAPANVILYSTYCTGTAPLSYFWDFGNGITSTQPTAGHQYTNPGTYKVTLKVSNSAGSDTDTITISIS